MSLLVASVYVIYNPNISVLIESIGSIIKTVDKLIVVDNSQKSIENYLKINFEKYFFNIVFIHKPQNVGIAFGQNLGLELAKDYQYIMLSDQDTIYPTNYLNNMIAFSKAHNSDVSFPSFLDPDGSGTKFFYGKGCFFYKKIRIKNKMKECLPSAQGIASGSLIKNTIIKNNILMNEDLFIDWVDFEWCWRVESKGYSLNQSSSICISHRIGEETLKILGWSLKTHSPVRHYYILRNALYLLKYNPNLNLLYKITLFLKCSLFFIVYPIVFTPRMLNLKFVLRAVKDFYFGRLGKFK